MKIEKYYEWCFQKFQKPKYDHKNTQKPKNQNIQKVMYGSSNVKSSENQLQLELKNIKNDIFKKFKNSKITPKTAKTQNF